MSNITSVKKTVFDIAAVPKETPCEEVYGHPFKIAVIGVRQSGKTAFCTHIRGNTIVRYVPTAGVVVHPMSCSTDRGILHFDLWDVSGAENFLDHCSGADGVIIFSKHSNNSYDKELPESTKMLNTIRSAIPTAVFSTAYMIDDPTCTYTGIGSASGADLHVNSYVDAMDGRGNSYPKPRKGSAADNVATHHVIELRDSPHILRSLIARLTPLENSLKYVGKFFDRTSIGNPSTFNAEMSSGVNRTITADEASSSVDNASESCDDASVSSNLSDIVCVTTAQACTVRVNFASREITFGF